MPTAVMPVIKAKNPVPFVPEPTKRNILLQEFEQIRLTNGGVLLASSVVAYAEDETSPLHRYFQWDDTEAAREYRLMQARQLISAVVVMIPNSRRPITAYVSLRDDRMLPEGGYRAIVDVLSNTEQRSRLLYEALDDLKMWERKYRQLAELVPVYQAIESVRKKHHKKK
jgi:hypothetical protein